MKCLHGVFYIIKWNQQLNDEAMNQTGYEIQKWMYGG